MYIALRQGQTNPWVQNFDVNRNLLPLRPFVAKQKNLFEFRFYTHFFMFFFTCIYSPGEGADNPLWTKFWCQQKGLVTLPICCKFGYGEEDFWRDVTIYGRDGHLGHVTQTPWTNFRSPIPLRLHMKFGFDRPSDFGEEDLWKWWTTTMAIL